MRPIWLRTNHVPFGQLAITLWPFILITPSAYEDECIRVHELYHWRQALRWGVIPWYVVYGVLALIYGVILRRPANEHPLERPAYAAERRCNEGASEE